jgi:hypothetical protein
MPKHTPGPWQVNGREVKGPPDSGVIVARLPEWGILADCPDQAPANAALIAAAPDLLAALKLCQARLRSMSWQDDSSVYALERARAAIARATGA